MKWIEVLWQHPYVMVKEADVPSLAFEEGLIRFICLALTAGAELKQEN